MNGVKIDWIKDMRFEAMQDNHTIVLDVDQNSGGGDAGPRPKNLMLTALGGCTGMDVVSILRKMRVEDYQFRMEISAEMTEEHPKIFSSIAIKYLFKGDNLPVDKIRKAVDLSETRYCGVSAMLKKVCEIDVKIYINDKEIGEGK
ncbi:MAG: OsmC family protein [Candidatus Cloacimonetes bacterium]|nr:OsmC family protein [Candidatus Cloacimonadota bacterium]